MIWIRETFTAMNKTAASLVFVIAVFLAVGVGSQSDHSPWIAGLRALVIALVCGFLAVILAARTQVRRNHNI
ncbi:MAG: hypothetical protein K0Q46_6623 [Rhodococcus erythropolis]|jgi:hypothetical protein|nr:hypothetical protein [Rhodococcus erythropolis]ORI17154.1 hypothetical protein BH686_00330 [Rhodococcus erythropolis]